MGGMRLKLSLLWIFATVNYIYADVLTLMNPDLLKGYLTGSVNGISVTPGFLLAAGALVEIPMAMILLAWFLPFRANRWANIAAGSFMTVVQLASLFVGKPDPYYLFFSAIEIATTAAIVWLAWKWKLGAVQAPDDLDDRKAQAAGA
jgi:hypothetical protein